MRRYLDAILKLTQGPIAKTGLTTILLRMINITLGFVVTLTLARFLGITQFGVYSYAVSAAMLIALISRCGFDLLLVKAVPACVARADWSSLASLLRSAFRNTLVISLILGAAFWAFEIAYAGGERRLSNDMAVLAALTGAMMSLTFVAQGVLRGFQNSWAYAPQFLIVQIVMFAGVMGLMVFGRASLLLVIFTFLFSWTCAAATACGRARYEFVSKSSKLPSTHPAPSKLWHRTAILIFACHSSVMLGGHMETFILGAVAGVDSAAAYALALRFAQLILIPAFSISAGLAPKIAELYNEGAIDKIVARSRKSAVFTMLGAGVFAILSITAFTLTTAIIGADYNAAKWPLIIMAFGYFLGSLAGRPLDVMLMTGHEKTAAKVSIYTLAASFLFCLLFTPAGGTGAAAAVTSIAFAGQQWTLAFLIRKLCGYRVDSVSILTRHLQAKPTTDYHG